VIELLLLGGLAVLAGSVGDDDGPRAVLTGAAVAYAIAGTLWCVVLGARTRVTPALARMAAAGSPTEPAEALLGKAIGGVFEAFMVITEAALIAIGVTLALGGGIAAPVAWAATLIAVLALRIRQVRRHDPGRGLPADAAGRRPAGGLDIGQPRRGGDRCLCCRPSARDDRSPPRACARAA
jgi:hypothetical protein